MPAKMPWFKFFPSDWRAEQSLCFCSLEARGLWIELLCVMHASRKRGYVIGSGNEPITNAHLGLLCRCSEAQAAKCVEELLEHGAISKTSEGHLYCRRMAREEEVSQKRSEAGAKGGKKKARSALGWNVSEGFVYAIKRSTDGAIKLGAAKVPEKRVNEITNKLKKSSGVFQELKIVGKWPVKSMGTSEAIVHLSFESKRISGEWFTLTQADLGLIQGIIDSGKILANGSAKVLAGSASASASAYEGLVGDAGEEGGCCGHAEFSIFEAQYRNKVSMEMAKQWWGASFVPKSLFPKIMAALKLWNESKEWSDQDGKFIPKAKKFLVEEYWKTPPGQNGKAAASEKQRQNETKTQKILDDHDRRAAEAKNAPSILERERQLKEQKEQEECQQKSKLPA